MTALFEDSGDAPASTSTPYTMLIGDTFEGTISTSNEEDWIAISLTEGQRVRFDLEGDSLSDPYLYLYDPSGNLITYNDDGGRGLNSRIGFRAPETGTYYISAAAYSTYTGTYTLTVTEIIPDYLTEFADDWTGDNRRSHVFGLDGDDTMRGLGGNDRLNGQAGNDSILGGDGNDRLFGGGGDDTLIGGAGEDRLFDGAGNDLLRGGIGNDTIQGTSRTDGRAGVGFDTVFGGAGNDYFGGQFERVIINGGDGDDYINIRPTVNSAAAGGSTFLGGEGNDTLVSNSSDDTMRGGNGNDFFVSYNHMRAWGGDGDDIFTSYVGYYSSEAATTVHGGDGTDRLNFEVYASGRYVVSLDNPADSSDGIRVTGIEHIAFNGYSQLARAYLIGNDGGNEMSGGYGNDTINGGLGQDSLAGRRGNDLLRGENGADLLLGEGGNDLLHGGLMNDTLRGGHGNDTLIGGLGDDILNGGLGMDMVDYMRTEEAIVLDLSDSTNNGGGVAGDILRNIEGAHGTIYSDQITGDANNNRLIGFFGDDTLSGAAGSDTLSGGYGRDILEGGAGRDFLSGGGSADEFRFRSGDGRDVIRDFNVNHDTLALSSSFEVAGVSIEDMLNSHSRDTANGLLIEFSDREAILLEGLDSSDIAALADQVTFI